MGFVKRTQVSAWHVKHVRWTRGKRGLKVRQASSSASFTLYVRG